MKTWDILCSKTTPNTLKQKPISFENTVNILFRTVSADLGHSWLNTPQKETTKSQHASTQIPKISYLKHRHTKTVNPETKISTQNQDWKHTVPRIWERPPKYLTWESEKNRNGFGDLKQFHEAPILHVWGLSFELRRRMEIWNKLFQKISLNKIT